MTTDPIAPEESRDFRRMRRVFGWMTLAGVVFVLAGSLLPNSWPVALFTFLFIGAYASLAVPVLLWPCPRCHRFYSLRFWLIIISWPWFDQCLHCGAELVKTPREDP